jgi:hypothetical protein
MLRVSAETPITLTFFVVFLGPSRRIQEFFVVFLAPPEEFTNYTLNIVTAASPRPITSIVFTKHSTFLRYDIENWSSTWGTRRHFTSIKTKHRNRLNLEPALILDSSQN